MSISPVKQKIVTSEEFSNKKQKLESAASTPLPLALLDYITNFLPYPQTARLYRVCKQWSAITTQTKTFASDNPLTTDLQITNILKKCPRLTSIELYLPKECEKTMQALTQLTHLTQLKLQGSIQLSHLEKLYSLKQLKSIRINSWRRVTNEHLHALAKIDTLETIDLRNQINIDFNGLKPLFRLKNLKKINLQSCPKITANAIRSLHYLRIIYNLPKVEVDGFLNH